MILLKENHANIISTIFIKMYSRVSVKIRKIRVRTNDKTTSQNLRQLKIYFAYVKEIDFIFE